MLLTPTPLTPSAFAPFGAVLAHDGSAARAVNAGTARRTDLGGGLGGLAERDVEAAPALAVYRLAAQALPLSVRLFERHPGSPQVFAALTVERFLVVVAPAGPDGLPDPAGARAVLGGRGATICYKRGQWHAPMVALDADGDMLMFAFERGADGDTVEHRLPAAVLVADRP